MSRRREYWLIVLLGPLLWAGCLGDLPRDNPLDPRSDRYEPQGRLEGVVTRLYPPYPPLAGVAVRLLPAADSLQGGRLAYTGSNGRFAFDELPSGDYRLVAQATGFRALQDTLAVSIAAGQTQSVTVRMNALPRFTDYTAVTVHISRWWPATDLYRLEVEATVTDPDDVRDVVRVWLKIPALGFADTLEAAQPAGRFFKALLQQELPGGSLHNLLGYALYLGARDRTGDTVYTPAFQLARVIEAVPVALDPRGLAAVDTTRPVLRWEPMNLPFAFTYRIDLVRREADLDIPILTLEGLASTRDSIRVPQPLTSGVYYWMVSVVDIFGNRSRSKEAGFQVP